MAWNFKISYSSYSKYIDSQLMFYFYKIINASPDTETKKIWGNFGTAVHKFLQNYAQNTIVQEDQLKEWLWTEYKLDELEDYYGNKSDINEYHRCIEAGKKFIDEKLRNYESIECEKTHNYTDEELGILKVTGDIDIKCVDKNGDIHLFDWKTNNSPDPKFKLQRKLYSWMCYKIYGKIPTTEWVFLKHNITHKDTFTKEELDDFTKELCRFRDEILEKGTDISKYEIGDIDNIFNAHKGMCQRERDRRNNINRIIIGISDNKIYFDKDTPESFLKMLNMRFRYRKTNFVFSPKVISGEWDGYYSVARKKDGLTYYPIGFLKKIESMLVDYNEHYKTNYELKIIDNRDHRVRAKYKTKFKESILQERDYQTKSREAIKKNKIGICFLATGLGKSLIAINTIKELNMRTIYLVNRNELVEQTHEDMEKLLGVKCGKMVEGNLVTDKQITIASVQTIHEILKKNDDRATELKHYLLNVAVAFWDECHGVGDSAYYKSILKSLINAEYIIGLSGTPFRNDGATLEMNGVVGFPLVEYSTKWGEENGWLCPTKSYFINYECDSFLRVSKGEKYHIVYDNLINNNEIRNNIVYDLVKKFRGKKILVLTKEIEHAQTLYENIPDSFIINSKVDMKTRRENMREFKSGKGGVMIAGIKILSAGINIPDLDIIINPTAHRSIVDSIQIIGRVKRTHEGKKYGYYIDFNDRGYFSPAKKERIKMLVLFGNNVEIIDSVDDIIYE